jgi:hypothetical protein
VPAGVGHQDRLDVGVGESTLEQRRDDVLADVPEMPVGRRLVLGVGAEVVDVAVGVVRERDALDVPPPYQLDDGADALLEPASATLQR